MAKKVEEEKVEGEEQAEGEEKPKKEKKDMGGLIKLLGMVALVLVLIVVVIIVSSNVAKKSIAPPDEEFEPEKVEAEEGAKHEAEKPLHDNYIGDFTAKLADIEEPHYVKITDLTLKYDPIKYKLLAAELGERDAEIKDTINTILISKTSEVNSVKGKEELKEEIKEKINAMLIEGQIPEVLFQVIVQ